jgi:hypothetical protein
LSLGRIGGGVDSSLRRRDYYLPMRFLSAAVAVWLLGAGCRSGDNSSEPRSLKPSATKGANLAAPVESPAATPTNASSAAIVLPTSGRIERVNLGKRFVVIDYTLGGMPALESLVNVYRNDQKVGELRLSGPEKNGFVAADILDGFIQVDDEVRVY